jgi:hypothetical protein
MTKLEKDYYIKDSKTNRLHAQCKDCYKEHRVTFYAKHYQKYKIQYQERARLRRERVKTMYRNYIVSYLKKNPCIDCGENDIRVLELDHIDPNHKRFSVSQGVRLGYSQQDIENEVKKCRVLCANCHKKRTAVQFGWHKS